MSSIVHKLEIYSDFSFLKAMLGHVPFIRLVKFYFSIYCTLAWFLDVETVIYLPFPNP